MSETETYGDLLHAMHDAAKFAEGAAKAILEGVLHAHDYAGRRGPYRGTECECDHCCGWVTLRRGQR